MREGDREDRAGKRDKVWEEGMEDSFYHVADQKKGEGSQLAADGLLSSTGDALHLAAISLSEIKLIFAGPIFLAPCCPSPFSLSRSTNFHRPVVFSPSLLQPADPSGRCCFLSTDRVFEVFFRFFFEFPAPSRPFSADNLWQSLEINIAWMN